MKYDPQHPQYRQAILEEMSRLLAEGKPQEALELLRVFNSLPLPAVPAAPVGLLKS